MPERLDKNTVIPLGIVISILLFFLYSTTTIVAKYVKLETKVHVLEINYQNNSARLLQLNEQISELNDNVIRLSEIMRKLEEKIR